MGGARRTRLICPRRSPSATCSTTRDSNLRVPARCGALLRHPQAQIGWLPTDDDCLLAYMRRISRRAAFQRTFAKAPAFLEAAAKL